MQSPKEITAQTGDEASSLPADGAVCSTTLSYHSLSCEVYICCIAKAAVFIEDSQSVQTVTLCITLLVIMSTHITCLVNPGRLREQEMRFPPKNLQALWALRGDGQTACLQAASGPSYSTALQRIKMGTLSAWKTFFFLWQFCEHQWHHLLHQEPQCTHNGDLILEALWNVSSTDIRPPIFPAKCHSCASVLCSERVNFVRCSCGP